MQRGDEWRQLSPHHSGQDAVVVEEGEIVRRRRLFGTARVVSLAASLESVMTAVSENRLID